MLADLCLCALVLFTDRSWSSLDTKFLDMDPPMMSWSLSDHEYDKWEETEYVYINTLGRSLVTGRLEGYRDDSLHMVRDTRPGYVLSDDRACGEVRAMGR